MATVALPPSGLPTSAMHQQHPSSSSSSSSEAVYTKLIQTYLNLLCYDNAIFLAERNAAEFPSSENSIYLLAYCYYRNGNPKSARSILLNRWLGRKMFTTTGDDDSHELECTRSSTRYLLAKCCYDLGLYSEAEEIILRHCRELFTKSIADGNGVIDGVKIRGNRNEAMDAWIITQSTSNPEKVCPIPSGSAGLYLLGNICRRTNRRQRAIEYYRLSLKLDPLLWTSYEALCELGGAPGKADEADDPNMIFGVQAPTLSPRNVMVGGQQNHGFMRTGGMGGAGGNNASAGDQQSVGSSFLNRFGTPSTPYTGFGKMNIGTSDFNTTQQQHQQTGGGATTVNFHLPGTASTIAPRTRGRKTGDGLPQQNLFASTPALATAQEETSADQLSSNTTTNTATKTPANDTNNPDGSAIGYANQVLDRARRVVAGIAYEPSPESINHPSTATKSQRKARFATEFTFSSTPGIQSLSSATPAIQMQPPPFDAGVSTVKGEKGEKRALFTTTEEKDEEDAISSRRKSPKKEERSKDEMVQTSSEEDEPGVKSTGGGLGKLDMDVITETEHVEKVLELLCGVGAAYKYLCQVSVSLS